MKSQVFDLPIIDHQSEFIDVFSFINHQSEIIN